MKDRVFDLEHKTKALVFLKGVGRYCQNPSCHRHLFGKSTQKFCSDKCRWKMNALRNPPHDVQTLHANFNLRTYGVKNKYRIIKFYLKKGVSQEIKITPESKELWVFLDKIENLRKVVIIP